MGANNSKRRALSGHRRAFGGIRLLPSKRYQAYYTGPDARRHVGWSTYVHKADAEAWLRDEELLIDRGTWTPPVRRQPIAKVDAIKLAEYAEVIIRRRAIRARKPLRPTTVDLYRKILRVTINPGLGHVALVDLTPTLISQWYDSLDRSSPTQNGNAYQLLRSILADAVDEALIDANPCRLKGAGKPAPARKPEALNIGELSVYLANLPERVRVLLMLTSWCGLRSGEARALRRCDVADDGSHVHIERTVTRIQDDRGVYHWHYGPPKTDAGVRTVAVPPHLQPALVAWLDAKDRAPHELLFPAEDGIHPINTSTLHDAHASARKAIGRTTVTVHDLRRTGATLAGQTGATIKELMAFLGHTQPTVAMLYQVADAARDIERARRMSALTTGS